MKRTGMTDRIRDILRQAGEPLSIAQILEGLPEAVERNNVTALLQQRKRAGEFSVSVIDGKPHYALVPGFVMPCPQRANMSAAAPSPKPAPEPVSPPAPARAHSCAPTGTTPAVSESPASPTPPNAAAPPHAATTAAAPETSRTVRMVEVTLARALADDIAACAKSLATGTEMPDDIVRLLIDATASANHLTGLLAARSGA